MTGPYTHMDPTRCWLATTRSFALPDPWLLSRSPLMLVIYARNPETGYNVCFGTEHCNRQRRTAEHCFFSITPASDFRPRSLFAVPLAFSCSSIITAPTRNPSTSLEISYSAWSDPPGLTSRLPTPHTSSVLGIALSYGPFDPGDYGFARSLSGAAPRILFLPLACY